MNISKTKTIALRSFVLLQLSAMLFTPNASLALLGGAGPDIPDASEEFNKILEEDLNLSVDELSKFTETVNYADRKGEYPRVTIQFNNPHPKEGELVTATALTTSLKDPTSAYFTWYIKNPSTEGGDIESFKRDAVQRHVKTYFDWLRYDEPLNTFGGVQPNGNGIVEFEEFRHTDEDADGYRSRVGGDTADDKNEYCYVYDRRTGEQYELAGTGGEDEIYKCPGGKKPVCFVEIRKKQCEVLLEPLAATADGGGTTADGSGGTTTDGGSVAIDGVQQPNAVAFQQCSEVGPARCSPGNVVRCKNPLATAYCEPEVRPDATGEVDIDLDQCPTPITWAELLAQEEPVYFHKTYDTCEKVAAKGGYTKEPSCFYQDSTPGGNPCAESAVAPSGANINTIHLFPEPDGGGVTGDGFFGAEEEFFWEMDGTSANTTPFGLDEEFVTGLGVATFTWRYREGDELGVVVEGLGTSAAKHIDSSEQTLFLFMNGCDISTRPKSVYLSNIGGGKEAEIKTIQFTEEDLNNCIIDGDNFVSPGESERSELQVGILGVDPNFTLQNAIGHTISLEGTITNQRSETKARLEQASFRWSFACHPDRNVLINPETAARDDRDDRIPLQITQDIVLATQEEGGLGSSFPVESFHFIQEQQAIEGSGLNTLEVPIELPESCFTEGPQTFMRARLIVNEPGDNPNESNFGRSDAIFPVTNNPTFIQAHRVTVAEAANPVALRGEEICGIQEDLSDLNHALCRVISNEVFALHVPELSFPQNVQWTVNGDEIFCNNGEEGLVGGECNQVQDTIFLPILEEAGANLVVTATINDPTQPDDIITASRILSVVEPEVRIVPGQNVTWKLLGQYRDLGGATGTGASYDQYSDTLMEIGGAGSVTLAVAHTPAWVGSRIQEYVWRVNGGDKIRTTAPTHSFVPDNIEDIRIVTNAELSAEVATPHGIRQWLSQEYDINQFETASRFVKSEITIQERALEGEQVGNGVGGTLFASVLNNTSQYFLFLLKMVLVMGTLLFGSVLLMQLTQRRL